MNVFYKIVKKGSLRIVVLLSQWLLLSAWADIPEPVDGRIGLVLSYKTHAIYQTKDGKEECPEGFHFTQNDNFKAQFPTEEEREAVLKKYIYYTHRGPNGENVFYHPTVIKDPLPLREVKSNTGLGLNLDGRVDENDFISPEGETGIDNELYRVIGCIPGWRYGGTLDGYLSLSIRGGAPTMRMLIEISDIDDVQNDDDVTVVMYRGRDGVEVGPDNNLIPFRSQRIDYREGKRYIHKMKGKIVDGTLYTNPLDTMIVPVMGPGNLQDFIIKDARFQLKLTESGAEGYLGGYFDVERWWLNFSKTWGAHFNADVVGWSGPATYAALYHFADKYPDENGRNTAISSAYKIEFVRSFVIHKDGEMDHVGSNPTLAVESGASDVKQ